MNDGHVNEGHTNGQSNNRHAKWLFFKTNSKTKLICDGKRKHKNTPYNCLWVNLTNLMFSLLAIIHLAYLGSTFDGKEEVSKIIFKYD